MPGNWELNGCPIEPSKWLRSQVRLSHLYQRRLARKGARILEVDYIFHSDPPNIRPHNWLASGFASRYRGEDKASRLHEALVKAKWVKDVGLEGLQPYGLLSKELRYPFGMARRRQFTH